ncbi:MAG TPA: dolichol-P-glucose synthetase [Acidobacterium sp.]|nr:dolichol-P-glucose synthetase [Acidobacterium sp.]
MPCLNEAETLAVCIGKARDYLERSGVSAEIVIGDNGSTDGSQAIALSLGARVVNVTQRGYGSALYGASLAAQGRYIIMADSDDSYDFSNLDPFISKLREGYDLVMGNRFKGGIKPGAMPWKNRYIGNPILSSIGKALFRCPASDFHCGIRGFSKEAFHRMDLRTTGMEYASEMVIKATLMNMKITEVPTTLSPDGRSRPPHLRPYRDGWRHLRFMLLFSPNWLFLYPGTLLMLIGIAGSLALMLTPIHIHHVRLGIDSLIYFAFMVIAGYQSVLFAILSRVYSVQENLYPGSIGYRYFFRHIGLERGLIAGGLLLATGLGAFIYALVEWQRFAFGMLDIEHIARICIPSGLTATLGIETILFSFFLSTLGMSVRHHPTESPLDYVEPERARG